MESGISWHFRQGGIYVDPHTMESSVPGLFLAGGVGGHSNGSVAVATFDGNKVAETIAGKHLPSKNFPDFPEHQLSAESDRVLGMLRPMPPGGIPPMNIKNRLWQLMWEKMGFIKTEPGMQEALAEIAEIRRDLLPRVGLKNTTKSFNYGWVDYLDIFNMLDVCELTVQSALNRKESRGAFYRTDHPYTDNKNWLTKNILQRADDNGGLKFRSEPYDPKYLKPEFEKQEFFSVNW
jgi:succinate dehydrogenase/fumarate reductase flavoprotein subunit